MIDLKTTTEVQASRVKLLENRDWLDDHLEEIQREYGGDWIAVFQKRVIARGESSEAVKEKIGKEYNRGETILLKVPKGDISQPI